MLEISIVEFYSYILEMKSLIPNRFIYLNPQLQGEKIPIIKFVILVIAYVTDSHNTLGPIIFHRFPLFLYDWQRV